LQVHVRPPESPNGADPVSRLVRQHQGQVADRVNPSARAHHVPQLLIGENRPPRRLLLGPRHASETWRCGRWGGGHESQPDTASASS
jgi:hypothetical protein